MAEKAVLLANLGSPNSCEVKDVRSYLSEFLMDPRVIDTNKFWRTILVKGIIVPFRSPKSAEAYKTVWTDEGSPLIITSENVQKKLEQLMDLPVELCMRYANPTPKVALDNLHNQNPDLKEVILFPMYPHYAMSSYETAVEHVKSVHKMGGYNSKLTIVQPFYNHEAYIDSLVESMKPFLEKDYDHLLFSYHGIPQRHVIKSDCTGEHCFKVDNCCSVPSPAHEVCYRHQIIETTELTAEKLNLPKDKYSFSFQSRLGRDPWLQPYTAKQFEEFPKQGIKKLVVVCPAFVSDCLETLEEIMVEGKEEFLHAGGEEFTVIPCLNERPDWIETIEQLVEETSELVTT